jgi:chromosome segregation ATPase
MKMMTIFLLSLSVVCAVFVAGCDNKSKQQAQQAMAELETVQAKLAEALTENKSIKTMYDEAKVKIEESEMLALAKQELEADVKTLTQEKEAMVTKFTEAQSQITTLTEQVKKYVSEISSLKDANTKLQAMIDQLKSGAAGKAIDAVMPATN